MIRKTKTCVCSDRCSALKTFSVIVCLNPKIQNPCISEAAFSFYDINNVAKNSRYRDHSKYNLKPPGSVTFLFEFQTLFLKLSQNFPTEIGQISLCFFIHRHGSHSKGRSTDLISSINRSTLWVLQDRHGNQHSNRLSWILSLRLIPQRNSRWPTGTYWKMELSFLDNKWQIYGSTK